MRFPALFINHGGGPLPLLGQQPKIVSQLQLVTKKYLPIKPDAIVVFSAHYEANPIQITSAAQPGMIYDYYGFPPETYKYKYDAPGSPSLAQKIQSLLATKGIKSELNHQRGYDHGVYVPLMIMYPAADIPVVVVSLHPSLSAEYHIQIGAALSPLRDNENILLLGSGYTYHNMEGFFHPSTTTYTASTKLNEWLKGILLSSSSTTSRLSYDDKMKQLQSWDTITAPYGRLCHPREEHLLPLFIIAATSSNSTASTSTTCNATLSSEISDSSITPSDQRQQQSNGKTEVVYEQSSGNGDHAITSFIFYE